MRFLVAISAAALSLGCAIVTVEEDVAETYAVHAECVPDCEHHEPPSCDPATHFTVVCTGGVDVSDLYCTLAGEQRCGGDVWCCKGTPD